MPSQLYTNTNVSFICARNFTYAGEKYYLGDEWDQELHPGEIDKLVRTRYLYPVVDSTDEKPRHWHHHVHIRSDIEKKLGVHRDKKDTTQGGETLYNKVPQIDLPQPNIEPGSFSPWEETADKGAAIQEKARENFWSDETPKEEETAEEVVELEEDEPWNPADYNVDEVNEYLAGDISEEERERVYNSERLGKGRKGILSDE